LDIIVGPHACQQCLKSFATITQHDIHSKTVHSLTNLEIRQICPVCNRVFQNSESLKIHRARTPACFDSKKLKSIAKHKERNKQKKKKEKQQIGEGNNEKEENTKDNIDDVVEKEEDENSD